MQRWSDRVCPTFPLALLLLALAGCSGGEDLGSVQGKITLDGQPLENAFVVYAPTTKGTTSYGRTNAQGEYEMYFSDDQKGAWIGENLVRISTGDVGSGGNAGPRERVPTVYNQQTTLKKTVQSGTNVFDFELKSTAGTIAPAPTE